MKLLEVRDATKLFDQHVAIRDFTLSLKAGERRALIGPNGAGKSTLLNLISGQEQVTSGQISFHGQEIQDLEIEQRARLGISRMMQSPSIFPKLTLLENTLSAVHQRASWTKYSIGTNERAMNVLVQVGLADKAHQLATELSHGEKKSLELGMALATKPKLLLLDEPMAGLSEPEQRKVLELLREYNGVGLLFIEHNMQIVFELANSISVLCQGQLICEGAPEIIRSDQRVQDIYLSREFSHA